MFSLLCMLGRSMKASPILVYFLSVALAFSIIPLFLLAFLMYKLKKNICSVCKGKTFTIKLFTVFLYWPGLIIHVF